MRYACSNNLRIDPQPNAVGICQICGNQVKAYCGKINIWHWRHKNLPDCDSFYEPMSEWHKNWQNQFPEDWREVVLKRNNEIHFADIFTQKNLVIEFQNSSISTEKIIERELFYNRMIWVINANDFKQNLILTELLEEKITKLEAKYIQSNFNKEISKKIDFEISLLNADILDLKNKLIQNPAILERKKKVLKTYVETIQDLDNYITNIAFPKWQKRGRIFYDFGENLDMNEVEIRNLIIESHLKINSQYNLLVKIEIDLNNHKSSIQEYELIENLEGQKKKIQDEIRIQKKLLQEIHNEVKTIFLEGLPNLINKEQSRIDEMAVDLLKINQVIISKKIEEEQLKKNKEKRISNFLKEKSLIFKQEMMEIEKEFENIFSFEWKHQRRSWKTASKPIYLDLGDEYLFEIKSKGLLQRMSKTEFIQFHCK